MRPDPFKRVGAYCFCRSVLFQPIDVFSRSWMMFPAGRIFSAVMSLLSAVRVFYRPYRIVPADIGILSRVCCFRRGVSFRRGHIVFDPNASVLAVRGEGGKRWRAAYIPNIRNEKRAAFAGWPFTFLNIVNCVRMLTLPRGSPRSSCSRGMRRSPRSSSLLSS